MATSWTASVSPREWNAVSNQPVILSSLVGTLVMAGTGDHTAPAFPPPPFKPCVYMCYRPVAGGLKLMWPTTTVSVLEFCRVFC